MKKLAILALALTVGGLAAGDALAKKDKSRKIATGTLDNGKLVVSWFSDDGLAFVETDEIDYFWAKDGFSMEGQTFHFAEWGEPEFVGPKADERDENDRRLARQMNGDMHRSFADTWARAFGNRARTSTSEGTVRVEGRIVDCSTGSTAAKMLVGFGAGAGNTTIDLRFVDKESGELVAALHHRVVSGTGWSTTDSKFFKWVRKAGEELAKRDFSGAYSRGDSVDE